MTIVLLVEGETERRALPSFFKRWLDPKLAQPVKVKPVSFKGSGGYRKDFAKRARRFLAEGSAVVGLLDWYGSGLSIPQSLNLEEAYQWAKQQLENEVGRDRFRQHFAVHETEAWLLSSSAILPSAVRKQLPRESPSPEKVDGTTPPSKRLQEDYQRALGRPYKKTVDGVMLFGELDPALAASKCPHLQLLFDDLLELAQEV